MFAVPIVKRAWKNKNGMFVRLGQLLALDADMHKRLKKSATKSQTYWILKAENVETFPPSNSQHSQ